MLVALISSSHHHLILNPVLSPSTEMAGFCIVIVFAMPCHLVRIHASSFTSQFLFILYLIFSGLFRSSSYSPTAHFKFQSLHYHIFNFFPQNMNVPPYTTVFIRV